MSQPIPQLEIMRRWLDCCRVAHKECRDTRQHPFTPTRLIDTQVFDYSQDVRLVEFSQDKAVFSNSTAIEWFALSHRWG